MFSPWRGLHMPMRRCIAGRILADQRVFPLAGVAHIVTKMEVNRLFLINVFSPWRGLHKRPYDGKTLFALSDQRVFPLAGVALTLLVSGP